MRADKNGMNRNSNPRTMRFKAVILLSIVLTGSLAFAQPLRRSDDLVPSGKGWGMTQQDPSSDFSIGTAFTTNGITYHGGPVMWGNVNVYFIWYGNWNKGTKASDSQITTALISELYGKTGGVSGSGLAQIMSTYHDSKHVASSSMALVKTINDNYSRGKTLTDAAVQSVVNSAISTGKLPKDGNGIYFVLSSSDVNETSGLCKSYCGWHNHAKLLNSDIKFAFVGNPDRCPLTCEVQAQSPNGDSGADAMASVMVHETFETIADPDFTGWYDSKGQEIGDKCAWKWGPVEGMFGYGAYNQTFRNRDWLIQMIWEDASGGGCAQDKGGKFYNQ